MGDEENEPKVEDGGYAELIQFSELAKLFVTLSGERGARKKRVFETFLLTWKRDSMAKTGRWEVYSFLRLLLPELDRERQTYGLKEHGLAQLYISLLGIPKESPHGQALLNWRQGNASARGGDFSQALFQVLQHRQPSFQSAQSDPPGSSSRLSIAGLNRALDRLAGAEGRREKMAVLRRLLRVSTAAEQMWVARIVLKDLKLGVSEKTVFAVLHPDALELFNVTSSLPRVCAELRDPTVRLQQGSGVQPFCPVKPMLANRRSVEAVVPLMRDRPFLIEEKYDGERVMLHRRAHELRLFSRNSNDVTSIYGPVALPLLRRCLSPDAPDCIIDGELLVWDSLASRFTDFGSLKTFARYGRSLDPSDSQDHPHHHQEAATPPSSTILTEEVMQANRFKQLCFVAFDVLLIGEQVTMQLPLEARRELLGRLVAVQIPRQFEIISSQVARSTADVIAALDRAIENRCEGIMVKASGSPYVPDERKDSWIKLKPEYLDGVGDDLDLLIVGGYFGTGERHRGTISNFMLGVRAPELSDESSAATSSSSSPIKFYSFCKVGTGYTQIELRALQDMLAPHWHQYDSAHPPSWLELAPPFQEKPDVYILPQFSKVLQIKAAQMVLTNKFRAGYTLRFPRVEKLRLDRSAADCMSHSEIIQLFAEFEGRMAHRCYEEGSGLGIANKRSRRAAAGAAPKGKKQRTVGAQFRATDVSSVAVEDLLFQGLVFCVMSGSEEHSKQELEILVHSHGGTLTQTGQKGVVFCVVAGSETVRVQNLIRADLDIVLPQWLLDCQATRRLIPLEPRYMLAASSATQKNFSQRFDCYGDSYTADTSPETLRSVFQQMEAIRSPPPAAAHTKSVGCSAVRAGSSELVLLDEQHIRKLEDYCISMGRSIQGGDSSLSSSSSSSNGWWRIFSGCVILFDHLVQSSSRPLSRSLQVAKPLCEFYGAKVTTDVLDPSMTHIVCDDKDPGRAQFFQSMKRPSTMLVKVAWIFESVQSHTKLSEQAFHC